MARAFLFSGSTLLAVTAIFHLTGWNSVAGWLDGDQGAILSMLWLVPAITWLMISAVWTLSALRRKIWTAEIGVVSIIPFLNGVLMLFMVSPLHPGGYMLIASSILAFIGAGKLK